MSTGPCSPQDNPKLASNTQSVTQLVTHGGVGGFTPRCLQGPSDRFWSNQKKAEVIKENGVKWLKCSIIDNKVSFSIFLLNLPLS